jgi:hypothetical protein
MKFSPRAVKKRNPVVSAVTDVYKDLTGGFRELKRQMGTAAQNVRAGYEKVRRHMR